MELLILASVLCFAFLGILLFALTYESILDDAVEEEWQRYNIRKDKEAE